MDVLIPPPPSPSPSPSPGDAVQSRESPFTIFQVFLRLGLTSFGGPIAHLAYFRSEIVERRGWMNDAAYSDLVALCQFLPGPASSQTGFALGLLRGGYGGGLAAWLGFTLPSAILMTLFADGAGSLASSIPGSGVLHGLNLVAVCVVAQAVWGMARTLCPDRPRASIATLGLLLSLLTPGAFGPISAIAFGCAAGICLCRDREGGGPPTQVTIARLPVTRAAGFGFLGLFLGLLVLPPVLPDPGSGIKLFNAFYRAGALVFGGGHVVLPLLNDAVVKPGWVSKNAFLAGYGAAQALPGPLFTFAAYLGAVIHRPWGGLAAATLALLAFFLPSFLLLLAALPFWESLRRRPMAQSAMRGANAAVVGVLGAALYTPLWTSAIHGPRDFAAVSVGCALLVVWRAPALLIVALGGLYGAGGALLMGWKDVLF